jgi:hypothetical protein
MIVIIIVVAIAGAINCNNCELIVLNKKGPDRDPVLFKIQNPVKN